MKFDISELIYKSISKTITPEEEKILSDWLSIPKNKILYQKIIDSGNINDKISIYEQIDTVKAYEKIEKRLVTGGKVRYLQVLKYAASAAVIVGVVTSVFFYQKNSNNLADGVLHTVDEKITIKMDNGAIKIIEEDDSTRLTDKEGNLLGVQNGNQIVYEDGATNEAITFNTIVVPYGKRFELVLSDGTVVHLNAGTSLKYPIKFLKNQKRQIFLNGEAYFDVVEDSKRPFVVNTNALDVQVYGTQFNVTAYEENKSVDVVLVEGSVGLYVQNNNESSEQGSATQLEPGYKGTFDRGSNVITVNKVNTSFYTSWIYGELVFRRMPFDQIIKRLERHYNISIVNENEVLGEELFNASFSNQAIENVLIYFNEIHEIDYKIENNKVVIK